MRWEQVCNDPHLSDLPYKIELNEWGKIIMSPVSIRHIRYQKHIAKLLEKLLQGGEALQEFPVQILDSESVKVADVVWIAQATLKKVAGEFASPIAPEICVEVVSPGNTKKEMLEKKQCYFATGAQEFWICDDAGAMTFFDPRGKLKRSKLVPNFPKHIEIA